MSARSRWARFKSRSCDEKERYATEAQARRRCPSGTRPYLCAFCLWFHVGHEPREYAAEARMVHEQIVRRLKKQAARGRQRWVRGQRKAGLWQ